MLTKEQQRRWSEALRSGEFEQGYRFLVLDRKGVIGSNIKFCCLGVFGAVCLGLPVSRMKECGQLSTDMHPDVEEIFGDYSFVMAPELGETQPDRRDNQGPFVHANDYLRLNFLQIANMVDSLPTKD